MQLVHYIPSLFKSYDNFVSWTDWNLNQLVSELNSRDTSLWFVIKLFSLVNWIGWFIEKIWHKSNISTCLMNMLDWKTNVSLFIWQNYCMTSVDLEYSTQAV